MFEVFLAALGAVPKTVFLAVVSVAIGIVFGLPVALVRFYRIRVADQAFKWFVTIIKGIPAVLMMLTLYLLLISNLKLKISSEAVTVIALSIMSTTGMSEIFRGALNSIDKSQFDAAYSVGHTTAPTLLRVVLPQIVPVSIPMLCNVCIGMIKAVALGSLIGIVDIMNTAVLKASLNYRYLEAYFAAAIIYWALCILMEQAFKAVERSFNKRIRKARVC
jgi:L-cystine transport system permease protein